MCCGRERLLEWSLGFCFALKSAGVGCTQERSIVYVVCSYVPPSLCRLVRVFCVSECVLKSYETSLEVEISRNCLIWGQPEKPSSFECLHYLRVCVKYFFFSGWFFNRNWLKSDHLKACARKKLPFCQGISFQQLQKKNLLRVIAWFWSFVLKSSR